MNERCRVYWGGHGCKQVRGHDGPHACDCCPNPAEHDPVKGHVFIDEATQEVGSPSSGWVE